jgi:hypothetical protein
VDTPRSDCVEESAAGMVCSRSAARAIFRPFEPWRLNMWVGTGGGGFSQLSATISAPVQDALGGTVPLAEAIGAIPIADTTAATATTPASHPVTFRLALVAPPLRRGCVWRDLVAMSITLESGHGNHSFPGSEVSHLTSPIQSWGGPRTRRGIGQGLAPPVLLAKLVMQIGAIARCCSAATINECCSDGIRCQHRKSIGCHSLWRNRYCVAATRCMR